MTRNQVANFTIDLVRRLCWTVVFALLLTGAIILCRTSSTSAKPPSSFNLDDRGAFSHSSYIDQGQWKVVTVIKTNSLVSVVKIQPLGETEEEYWRYAYMTTQPTNGMKVRVVLVSDYSRPVSIQRSSGPGIEMGGAIAIPLD